MIVLKILMRQNFRIQIQFPISDLSTIIFQIELEKLNSSTDVINKLELDLEVSNILLYIKHL